MSGLGSLYSHLQKDKSQKEEESKVSPNSDCLVMGTPFKGYVSWVYKKIDLYF